MKHEEYPSAGSTASILFQTAKEWSQMKKMSKYCLPMKLLETREREREREREGGREREGKQVSTMFKI
jgi:hypothetical protein